MFCGWSLILINLLLNSDSCFSLYLYLKTERTVVAILWLTVCTLNRSINYHPTTCGYSYNTLHYEFLYICSCLSLRVSSAWAFVFGREFARDWLSKLILGIVWLRFLTPPISHFFPRLCEQEWLANVTVLYLLQFSNLLGLMLIYCCRGPSTGDGGSFDEV